MYYYNELLHFAMKKSKIQYIFLYLNQPIKTQKTFIVIQSYSHKMTSLTR
jgi:hypothetical protein